MNPLSFLGGSVVSSLASLASGLGNLNATALALQKAQQLSIQSTRAVNQSFVQLDASMKNTKIGAVAGGAFDILMSTIGTVLTPITAILAAGFLTLAEIINRYVIPAMMELVKFDPTTSKGRSRIAAEVVGTAADLYFKATGSAGGGMVDFARGGGQGTPKQKSILDDFIDNLDVVRKELTIGIGRQGQIGFSGIADVWKQVQVKAFMSPFEQKQLDLSLKQVQALDNLIDAIRNRTGGVNATPVGQMNPQQFAERFGGAM